MAIGFNTRRLANRLAVTVGGSVARSRNTVSGLAGTVASSVAAGWLLKATRYVAIGEGSGRVGKGPKIKDQRSRIRDQRSGLSTCEAEGASRVVR